MKVTNMTAPDSYPATKASVDATMNHPPMKIKQAIDELLIAGVITLEEAERLVEKAIALEV